MQQKTHYKLHPQKITQYIKHTPTTVTAILQGYCISCPLSIVDIQRNLRRLLARDCNVPMPKILAKF